MVKAEKITHWFLEPRFLLVLVIVLEGILAIYCQGLLLQMSLLTLIFCLLIATLFFLPLAKTKIHIKNNMVLPLAPWLCRIIALQVGFYLVWFQTSNMLLIASQVNDVTTTFMLSQVGVLLNNGLHPWPWVLTYLVALHCVSKKGKVGKTSDMLGHTRKRKLHPTLLSAIDIAATFPSLICLLLPVILLYPIILSFITINIFPNKAVGLLLPTYSNYLIFISLMLVFYNKKWLKFCMKNTYQQKTATSILLQQLLLIAAVVICFSFMYFIFTNETRQVLFMLRSKDWFHAVPLEQAWFLLNYMFLVGAGPLLATWIYRMSNGYKISTVACAVLLFPACIAGLLLVIIYPTAIDTQWLGFTNMEAAQLINQAISFSHHLWPGLLLSTTSILLILGALYYSRTLNQSLIHMTANQAGKNIKRLRLQFNKLGPILAWGVLCFQLGGLYAIQAMMTLCGLGVIFCIMLPAIITVIKNLRAQAFKT